ncbi:Curli production assembly/transport component CsgG [Candidatus Magnetomorum sp. HK-1]|nr:Curli production assembly/transport component CsgG [Candidatus Magnetomorum sp. HK-1]
MKRTLILKNYLLIIFFVLGYILTDFANASDSFNNAITDISKSIVMELHRSKKLENKNLAIMGFRNEKSKETCKALSTYITDKLTAKIHEYQTFVNFNIVARHNLQAIENEILISKGSLTSNIMNYLKASDILITGSWLKGKIEIILKVKAFEINEKGIIELISKQKIIDKKEVDIFFSDCFKSQLKKIHNAKSVTKKISIIRQDSKSIKLKIKGDPPPNCNTTCKMQKSIKLNQRMAMNFISKRFKIKNIDKKKLTLNSIEYNSDYSAVTVYTYLY